MSSDLSRTAIITGGARGMGLATAKILGRDHRIIISDVDADGLDAARRELADAGIDAAAVVCDITDRTSVIDLFAAVDAAAPLRAVVHAAGVSPRMGDAATVMRINALGTVHVTQTALDAATDGFALVNVASIAGHIAPRLLRPTRLFKLAVNSDADVFLDRMTALAQRGPKSVQPGAAYSTSKAFVIWYSAAMAGEFGAKGARVLSVSPGSFDTDMGRLESATGSAKLVDFAALKRFGRPEEIAELLAFCAGDKPSYLTGTDILCDGGVKAAMGLKELIVLARG